MWFSLSYEFGPWWDLDSLAWAIAPLVSYTFWLEPNREFINELSHPNNIVVSFYMAIYFAFIMEHTKVITLMFPSKYLFSHNKEISVYLFIHNEETSNDGLDS